MKSIIHTLLLFCFCLILGCTSTPDYPVLEENTAALRDPALAPFYHGVASGDPLPTSVVLWTRVTPERQLPSIDVTWEIATDDTFSAVVGSGTFQTGPERDYTVKVLAESLTPGRKYFYRFGALSATSTTGTTKTTALSTDDVKLGVVSCSNYEFGYFNAYGALAKEELDAIVHLGDYIYEYGRGR